jgi:hypothetical protein
MTVQNLYNLRSTLLDLRSEAATAQTPVDVGQIPYICDVITCAHPPLYKLSVIEGLFALLLEYCVANGGKVPVDWGTVYTHTRCTLEEAVLKYKDTGRVVRECLRYGIDPTSDIGIRLEVLRSEAPIRFKSYRDL